MFEIFYLLNKDYKRIHIGIKEYIYWTIKLSLNLEFNYIFQKTIGACLF